MSTKRVSNEPAAAKAEVIILGIDVHADKQVVVRQIDGQTPQPAQSFTKEKLLVWIARQVKSARRVVSCYEAGPFGYVLHRELLALGVENLVVRPRNWDEYGQKVKTDQRDARALAEALDRYIRGNRRALSVVRVPDPHQEHQRSLGRQRESFVRELTRLAAMGRSHALYYGQRLSGKWWKPKCWEKQTEGFAACLLALLEPLRRLIGAVEKELEAATQAVESEAVPCLPKGLGALSSELISREIGDWNRFSNRRQVASYTGLCPGENSSGARRSQGSINKHGNPRIRRLLIEAVWRLIRYQPDYHRLRKWWSRLRESGGKASKSWKKKMVVAVARGLMIDLWRVRTGRSDWRTLGILTVP